MITFTRFYFIISSIMVTRRWIDLMRRYSRNMISRKQYVNRMLWNIVFSLVWPLTFIGYVIFDALGFYD